MCIHCVLGKVLICPDISKSSSDWTARSKALVIMPRKIRNFHYYDTMTTTYFPIIRVNVREREKTLFKPFKISVQENAPKLQCPASLIAKRIDSQLLHVQLLIVNRIDVQY